MSPWLPAWLWCVAPAFLQSPASPCKKARSPLSPSASVPATFLVYDLFLWSRLCLALVAPVSSCCSTFLAFLFLHFKLFVRFLYHYSHCPVFCTVCFSIKFFDCFWVLLLGPNHIFVRFTLSAKVHEWRTQFSCWPWHCDEMITVIHLWWFLMWF